MEQHPQREQFPLLPHSAASRLQQFAVLTGDLVRSAAVLAFWLVVAAAVLEATGIGFYAVYWFASLCFKAFGATP